MRRTNKKLVNNIIWSVALYLRLSREDGHDESLSIQQQKKVLLDYLEKEFPDQYELVDLYIDDGISGTTTERENFQRMLEDIDDGKVNCVIVKDLSRFTRDYSDAGNLIGKVFPLKGVRFISLIQPALDSYLRPHQINEISFVFQSISNEDHCRNTSEKIRYSFDKKRSKGEFIGAFAPYGYQKNPSDKSSFIIDEEAAQVVKDIFKWFLEGMSKSGIAKKLSQLEIPNPTAYKQLKGFNYWGTHQSRASKYWSLRTVDLILKNQTYTGAMVQGRTKIMSYKIHKQIKVDPLDWFIVLGRHEPIISIEDFELVQELLLKDVKPPKIGKEPYLFSGFLKCADCQMAMCRKSSKGYVYYSCSTYKTRSKKACSSHTIRNELLEKVVLEAINRQLTLVNDLSSLIDEISNSSVVTNKYARIEKALKTKETEIEKVNHIRDSLYADWKNGDISRTDYFRLRQAQDDKLTFLLEGLHALKEELECINQSLNSNSPCFDFYKQFKQIQTLDRNLIVSLIDTIFIGRNHTIEIKFKFQNQIALILSLIEEKQDLVNHEKFEKIKKFVL